MKKLTKVNVERAEVRAKPYFLFDSALSGFCLRIAPSGRRHYYVQYKHGTEKTKRMSVGRHGVMTAEQARAKALVLLGQIKAGADPQQEKIIKRDEPLVQELTERYLQEHAVLHCKPSTVDKYQQYVAQQILPQLGHMKVRDVQRSDIAVLHHGLRQTPYAANRCLEVISKMFNLAEMWGLRAENTNPRKHIKKYPMKARERYLSKDEAQRLGQVLERIKRYPDENIAAVYGIQLLLLTGCRLGEIQTLKWDYVDRAKQVLRLPDSKTGAKCVYIGDAVLALLDEIWQHPRRPHDNPYVIWGYKPGMYLVNIQKPWQRYRKIAGLADMRIHDLRHSFASFAVSQGMSLPILGKLLGHRQTQTTARYAHLMDAPMLQAAAQVTQELSVLMNVQAKPAQSYSD